MGLLDDAKKAWADTAPNAKTEPPEPTSGGHRQRYEYDVVELREKLLDGKGSAPTIKLRGLLNDRARDGWQLKHLVGAEVAGLIGKRDGWMVIFERQVA